MPNTVISGDNGFDAQQVQNFLFTGRLDEALEEIQAHLKADQEGGDLLRKWGRELMDRRQFDTAASVHRRLCELFPQDGKAYNALAVSLTMAGKLDEALTAMQKAADINPDSPSNSLNLGKLHMLRGEWSLGLVYLEKVFYQTQGALREEIEKLIDICRTNSTSGDSPGPGGLTASFTPPVPESEMAGEPVGLHPTGEFLAPDPAPTAPPAQAAARVKPAGTPPRLEPEPSPARRLEPVPCPVQATDRPLNILFAQESPCIRNYKMAAALKLRGHRVSLAYVHKTLSQMYPGLSDEVYEKLHRMSRPEDIWELSAGYDLVHCHNEPDLLTVAALGGEAPVVHDTHDLISLRGGGDPQLRFLEGLANRAAQGRVYTTPYQRDEVQKLYRAGGPSLVLYNYTSWADLPQEWLPKLSERDGRVHLVYEGGIGGNAHRDFSQLFRELDRRGIYVHIYPPADNPQLSQHFQDCPHVQVHPTVSPKEIIREMSQYDYGIIPFNLEKGNKRFLDSTIANKLFEYLAAGLPVVTSDLQSYRDFFEQNPVGFTFKDAQDIEDGLERLAHLARTLDFNQYLRTYEGEITRLEEFYLQILEDQSRPRPARTAQAEDQVQEAQKQDQDEPITLASATPRAQRSVAAVGLADEPEPQADRSASPQPVPSKVPGPDDPDLEFGVPSRQGPPPRLQPAASADPTPAAPAAAPAAAGPAAAVALDFEQPTPDPEPAPAPRPEKAPVQAPQGILALPLTKAILDLDRWVRDNGWAGFDPYDVKEYVLHQLTAGRLDQEKAQEILRQDQVEPEALRRRLGIKPQVNAKAMGLFLGSYALLENMVPERDFSPQVRECAAWLLEHPAPGMSGLCWGYPFDWESVVMIPAGTPTSVISYHVGDAFWDLYQLSGDNEWLERCLSVGEFMSQDLNQDQVGQDCLCFSYTPLDFYHVHNANLCVAEYLIRLGQAGQRPQWLELGRRALAFALRDLLAHGHLTYWARGYEPGPANQGQIDHYHTAAELRSLYRLQRLLPEEADLARGFATYMDFYLQHFFEDGTIPKIHPGHTYPVDIHAAAEAAYILGETAPEIPRAAETLERFIPWFLENCLNPDGSFIYRLIQGEKGTRKLTIPYMRWGQAWSMRGLVSALAAQR